MRYNDMNDLFWVVADVRDGKKAAALKKVEASYEYDSYVPMDEQGLVEFILSAAKDRRKAKGRDGAQDGSKPKVTDKDGEYWLNDVEL